MGIRLNHGHKDNANKGENHDKQASKETHRGQEGRDRIAGCKHQQREDVSISRRFIPRVNTVCTRTNINTQPIDNLIPPAGASCTLRKYRTTQAREDEMLLVNHLYKPDGYSLCGWSGSVTLMVADLRMVTCKHCINQYKTAYTSNEFFDIDGSYPN